MYINTATMEYPFSQYRIRALYPDVSFPSGVIPDATLAEFGIHPVALSEKPSGDVVTELTPALVDGVWTQQWGVRSFTQSEAAALIAARRYAEETGGFTSSGITILTDDRSQGKLVGAALAATLDPSYVCRWKTLQGFVDLDATAIIAVATALRNHVQGCFDREAELLAAVDDGTFTLDQLDEGW